MINTRFFFTSLLLTLLFQKAMAQTDDKLSKIDALFKDFNQPNVPGASVTVIKNGKPIFTKAYGMANLEKKAPCSTNTNFRLASVTKQFTAMAIMILAERGKLSLEDPI